VDVKWTTKINT